MAAADEWWAEALSPTQEEADAVVDVLLSVGEEPEWWNSVTEPAAPPPAEEVAWWLAAEGDSNPFSQPATPQASTFDFALQPEKEVFKKEAPQRQSFNRMLTRSLQKRKKPVPTPSRGPSTTSIIPEVNETNEDEAIEQVLSVLPKETQAAPTPTRAPEPSTPSAPPAPASSAMLAVPETKAISECFLMFSVERGEISRRHALTAARAVDIEGAPMAHAWQLRKFVDIIKKLATPGPNGRPQLLYGTLMENASDVFDPLASIVKTARSRGIVATDPELLYQRTTVTLLCDAVADADLGTYTFQQIREHSIRRQSMRSKRRPKKLVPEGGAPTPSTPATPATPQESASQMAAQLAMLDDAQAALMALSAGPRTSGENSTRSLAGRRSSEKKLGMSRRRKPAEVVAMVNDLPDESPALQRQLSVLVRRGTLSSTAAMGATRWVDKELRRLITVIQKLGAIGPDGRTSVTYGELDRQAGASFEPLSGVVKTASSRNIVELSSKLLLGRTVITLLKDDIPDSDLDTYSFQQIRQCSMRRPQKE